MRNKTDPRYFDDILDSPSGIEPREDVITYSHEELVEIERTFEQSRITESLQHAAGSGWTFDVQLDGDMLITRVTCDGPIEGRCALLERITSAQYGWGWLPRPNPKIWYRSKEGGYLGPPRKIFLIEFIDGQGPKDYQHIGIWELPE